MESSVACSVLNVVGAKSFPSAGDYFARFSEPDRNKWHPQTKDMLARMLVEVDAVKDNPEELEEIQFRTGIKYNPASLLWDPYLRDLVDAQHCHYWDAMHCLFTSGVC